MKNLPAGRVAVIDNPFSPKDEDGPPVEFLEIDRSDLEMATSSRLAHRGVSIIGDQVFVSFKDSHQKKSYSDRIHQMRDARKSS